MFGKFVSPAFWLGGVLCVVFGWVEDAVTEKSKMSAELEQSRLDAAAKDGELRHLRAEVTELQQSRQLASAAVGCLGCIFLQRHPLLFYSVWLLACLSACMPACLALSCPVLSCLVLSCLVSSYIHTYIHIYIYMYI